MNRRLLVFLVVVVSVVAQAIPVPFQNCSSSSSIAESPNQITVDNVLAQITSTPSSTQRFLNITLFGSSSAIIYGVSNDSQPLLATMFTTASVLTFTIFSTASAFCDSLRPPSPLPSLGNETNYCPLPAGQLAFSTAAPLNHMYELLSLNTRVRIVDTSLPPLELACIDISSAPLRPGVLHSVYGHAAIIFWVSVATAIAYWLVVGSARVAAAWKRGAGATPERFWSRVQRAGFVLVSAISGEKLANTPALLRFCTPSMRDVIFHTQWCAGLGMVAVQWPLFTYPVFAQTAWSTLTYNISLTQGANAREEHWDPLNTLGFSVPDGFTDQVQDPTSPLFISESTPNTLFNLPPGTPSGMDSFAYAVGIRPQDLFGVSTALFLAIIGGIIVLSCLIWFIDWFLSSITGSTRDRNQGRGSHSPRWSYSAKDALDDSALDAEPFEAHSSTNMLGSSKRRSRTMLPITRRWWRYRLGQNAFHQDVLWGNLIRVLILFHLPITTFAAFHFAQGRAHATLGSVVMAALAFAILSVCIPVVLIARLATTRTNKLYDNTETLLSLGPLYNQYASGSHTFATLFFLYNISFGLVIGCGQRSGTTQAIVLLVIEVVTALYTSVYLPWGRGAAMGVVSVGNPAAGWIACAILLIQGLIYLMFLSMLVVKIIEGLIRLFAGVPFDRSRHTVDNGLFGALGLSGVFGSRHGQKTHHRYSTSHGLSKSALMSQDTLAKGYSHRASSPTSSARPVPSVLRPEQARTPYREENDNETGYIMGAWQSFSQQYDEAASPRTPDPPKSKTGFSRVGGGRAHYDSPYAIMPTTPEPFPSVDSPPNTPPTERASSAYPPKPAPPLPTASTSSLPAGAMAPQNLRAHARTKSQTAVIEDVRSIYSGNASTQVRGGSVDSSSVPVGRSNSETYLPSEAETPPRRKHWFNRRGTAAADETSPAESVSGRWGFLKGRRRSEGDEAAVDDEFGEPLEEPKEFVVIRNKRPSAPVESTSKVEVTPPTAWKDPLSPASPPPRPPRSERRISGASAYMPPSPH
ncbi:hypothetical protein SISNIDRAFT_493081 [Sistotremastrum niveocremeum HHB9708]|uniref:TRP C-terminal domain-containing protein n=1 Tax=Sistotremastrum niveocremeum HHB9708 TaxID=1314777 RepID=A0A164ZJR0_9AGAM|nr:hypothetical protein SISNIDRAFT_493081 [Sistotremastrum niveocremeum HHB9708]